MAVRIICVAALNVLLFPSTYAQSQSQGKVIPRLIIRNAYIFTMAPSRTAPIHGYIVVGADGRIATVAVGDPPPGQKAGQTYDAQGHWIVPGFISAHSHIWQSAYRGLAADQTLMGWINALYVNALKNSKPEDFYWFTLEGALDHMRHGVTSAYNFAYGGTLQAQTGDLAEISNEFQFKAEQESGIRFVHGIDHGPGTNEVEIEAAKKAMKRFLDWSAKQPAARSESARLLAVMVNSFAAFMPDDSSAKLDVILMREFRLANQTHYLEASDTQVTERSRFPWFVDTGMLGPELGPRMIFGHLIHTDANIVATIAKAGAGMSWNPLSNGRLGSGVADIPTYLKAGIKIGMGVDGEASADLVDPFENMRVGLYAIRDKYESAAIMSPYDVMKLHTLGSAEVLGVQDRLGSLEPGKLADLLVIDPSHFGHVFDPYASVVLVASQPDLERVYIGGELMVDHGNPVKHNLKKIEAEVDRRVAAETLWIRGLTRNVRWVAHEML